MASAGVLGFLKGASTSYYDQIEKRNQHERELEKAKFLERLRAETQKELAVFENDMQLKNPNKEMSSVDYEKGKKIIRDGRGNELYQLDVPISDLEDYRLGREKDKLDLENTRSTIASRARDDARQDRLATAQIGAYNRSGGEGGSSTSGNKFTAIDYGNELVRSHEPTVARLTRFGVKQEHVSRVAERAAGIAMTESNDPAKIQQRAYQIFRDGMANLELGIVPAKDEKGFPIKNKEGTPVYQYDHTVADRRMKEKAAARRRAKPLDR